MKANRRARFAAPVAVLLVAAAVAVEAEDLALQDPSADPFATAASREAFLATAEVVSDEILDVGINQTRRARLSDGRVSHDAHVQTVDVFAPQYTTADRVYRNFRDSYKFNIAAYRVARLVGYQRVPVSVERKLGRYRAAFTWWVDGVAMMEVDRIQQQIHPPNLVDFLHQLRQARIFAQLVYNFDLNPGNILITDDWQVWTVDYSRSFRHERDLPDESQLDGRIDRALFEGMKRLEAEELSEKLDGYLTKGEIRALLKRRDLIVEHYEEQLATYGEAFAFCDDPHPWTAEAP